MINLAGSKDATPIIKRELARCGIEAIEDDTYIHPEVKTTTIGRLVTKHGEFRFHRNWRYWVARGLVPITIAKKLYEDVVGRNDIRVAGHCECPPPDSWTTWLLPDGTQVLNMKAKEDFVKCGMSSEPLLQKISEEGLKKHKFSDDPTSIGASGYVDTYHIDSELGLYIFVNAVKSI